MFQNINGVQIREHDETRELPNITEKRFEIEYVDNVYLHKVICLDFINMPVKQKGLIKSKDLGRHWMLVVKHNDFVENRLLYAEVGCIIHDKIRDFLCEEYGYESGKIPILMDQKEKVYKN
ncbi:hypothetical protein [Neobacillus sp. YIM B06451]|uniref:hypothetical protein n=1 Tax=Neobacillus sp. YIM B06451 TaxID=3070994 RepID=UPI0029318A78|nr:hypothetical protein [Neobacillus sp. YIM B06451]